jgi:hypothetical protein
MTVHLAEIKTIFTLLSNTYISVIGKTNKTETFKKLVESYQEYNPNEVKKILQASYPVIQEMTPVLTAYNELDLDQWIKHLKRATERNAKFSRDFMKDKLNSVPKCLMRPVVNAMVNDIFSSCISKMSNISNWLLI